MKITSSYNEGTQVPPLQQTSVGMLEQIYFAPSLKAAITSLSYLIGQDKALRYTDRELIIHLRGVFTACLAQKCYVYDPEKELFVWPTTLQSPEGQPIYCACIQKKRFKGSQWLDFAGWWLDSTLTSKAILLPKVPKFLSSNAVYDSSVPMDFYGLRHLLERKSRLPAPYSTMHDDVLRLLMIKGLENLRHTLAVSPSVAEPISYWGKPQLVAPLLLEGTPEVTAAVVLDLGKDDNGNRYYFPRTLLSLKMARSDARFVNTDLGETWLSTGRLHLSQAA